MVTGIDELMLLAFLALQNAWHLFIAMYILSAAIGAIVNYYMMTKYMKMMLVEQTTAKQVQYFCKDVLNEIKEYLSPHKEYLVKIRMSKPIFPETLDPNNIWEKMSNIISGYITDTYDYLRSKYGELTPEHVIECRYILVAQALEVIQLWAKHIEIATKHGLSQLENVTYKMLLAQLMKQALLVTDLIDADNLSLPMGDAAGPLTILHLTKELSAVNVDDMLVAEEQRDGKQILYITSGELNSFNFIGDKVTKIVKAAHPKEQTEGHKKCLLTLDAQGKLLSMETGEIGYHFGAAIGGIGLQKYRLEELTLDGYEPRAMTVTMSIRDAIAPMSKKIHEASFKLADAVVKFINDTDYEYYVVIGIGNQEGLRIW